MTKIQLTVTMVGKGKIALEPQATHMAGSQGGYFSIALKAKRTVFASIILLNSTNNDLVLLLRGDNLNYQMVAKEGF